MKKSALTLLLAISIWALNYSLCWPEDNVMEWHVALGYRYWDGNGNMGDNPPFFGEVPTGQAYEVAVAESEIDLTYMSLPTTLAIPMPVYSDGVSAELDEIIVCVRPTHIVKQWFHEGTTDVYYAEYSEGSGQLIFNAINHNWEVMFVVTVLGFRSNPPVASENHTFSELKLAY